MSGAADAIAESRAYCRRVARRAGSSFYPCFALLKSPKREAMEALYAFLRHTDDLADGPEPLPERRAALNQWRDEVTAGISEQGSGFRVQGSGEKRKAESGKPSADTPSRFPLSAFRSPHPSSLIPALADAVQRFRIPPEHLLAVLDGVQMDLDGRRYETFDELTEYCHKVASAVGLACIHIWGFRSEAAFEPARQCGLAFQLTNILRDLKEDAARGRVYLPAEDLRQCGYSAEELELGVVSAGFYRLLEMEVARAREFYCRGAELMDWLEPAGQRIFGMMVSVYYRLLCEIEHRREEVLSRRMRLSRWRRLLIAARWFLLPPRRSALP